VGAIRGRRPALEAIRSGSRRWPAGRPGRATAAALSIRHLGTERSGDILEPLHELVNRGVECALASEVPAS